MASLIYDAFMDDLVKGNHDFEDDTYFVMLVTSAYTPNKGLHAKRSDITPGEVSQTSTNYTTGGKETTPTLAFDTTLHRMGIEFSSVTWPTATITAKACVIYRSNAGVTPGPAAADALVAYVDFGQDVSSTAAAFAVTFSSALRLQN